LTAPFLSIIIPAYNEERRLPDTLEQALSFLNQQDYSAEVLVVENGSRDRTYQIAKDFSQLHPQFRVLQEPGRGKGLAVKRGMLASQGEYRFMCDADLSMPIQEINRFLPPALVDFDIAVASREAPGAQRFGEPMYRHLGGRLINGLIRLLALPGLNDTQCGFKCLRGAIAEDLFRQISLPGWSFDVELLFIARRRGYRIIELPIPWYYRAESKMTPVRGALKMGVDIITIHRNARQGLYDRVTSTANGSSKV